MKRAPIEKGSFDSGGTPFQLDPFSMAPSDVPCRGVCCAMACRAIACRATVCCAMVCCAAVCELLPRCCAEQWDEVCVKFAAELEACTD